MSVSLMGERNRNIAVFGASGSMNQSFCQKYDFSKVKRGKSDLDQIRKSGVEDWRFVYLKGAGPYVRVFNLVQPEHMTVGTALK